VPAASDGRREQPTPVAPSVTVDGTTGPALRVLYVLHTSVLGGSGGSLRYLLRHFPAGAVAPTVICPPGPAAAAFREDGVPVLTIPGVSMLLSIAGIPLRGRRLLELARTVWFMRYGSVLRRAIEEVRPDLVHLNERGMLHAARLAGSSGVPVVMHARSVADRETAWIRRLSTKLLCRYVDRVLAIDQSVRHSLREVPHVEVVYNPLSHADAAVRTPRIPAAESGRARVTFTYLTGLLGVKGIWDLVAAARLLRHRSEDVRFLIAGANSRPEAFHRSLAGRMAHLLGFAPDVEGALRDQLARDRLDHMVMLLGQVERTEELLAQTDVLVFPSHLNGPGRSVFEAGARGIPAIVAMRDRIEDVVVDGETGLVVPEKAPKRLAESIERLADDPGLRLRLGQEARTRYQSQFDPESSARRVLDIYRQVVARRSSGRRLAVPAGQA
jgi:glycosyltransferase involved in cell wall biosynthesis